MRPVVFCHDHPGGAAFDPDPAETSRRDVELTAEPPPGPFAAVGWGEAGVRAAALVAAKPTHVDRLVLCCVPKPVDGALPFDAGTIAAKTLLIYGQFDEDAPPGDARWWKDQLRGGRIEMVPRRGNDIIDVMWGRILSHAAPRTLR